MLSAAIVPLSPIHARYRAMSMFVMSRWGGAGFFAELEEAGHARTVVAVGARLKGRLEESEGFCSKLVLAEHAP
jgi:hypothetical protein